MRLTFKEVVADIWGPGHPYSARLGVKTEVRSGGRGFRCRRHRRMVKGDWRGANAPLR